MTTLATKLQLKAGQRMVVLNAPKGYSDTIKDELDGINVSTRASADDDAVLLFVSSLAEAAKLAPKAIGAIKPDGLLWIAYAKGGSGVATDVNRDKLWSALKPTGWRPVRQIALDNTWSAMRFKPADQVGTG